MEAASISTASASGLVTAQLAVSLDSAEPFADSFVNRLALGVAAGLIAVLVHGEFTRLSTEKLTWRALLGR